MLVKRLCVRGGIVYVGVYVLGSPCPSVRATFIGGSIVGEGIVVILNNS